MKSKPNMQRKKEQLSKLMAYDHIAPASAFVSSSGEGEEGDGEGELGDAFLADDVLAKVMCGKGGGDVSFVLQKIE